MKQFAHKTHSLSLVRSAAHRRVPTRETSSAPITDHFDGWLNSAVPTEVTENQASEESPKWPQLTYTDVTRVNRATVRESRYHRHWPVDVVEKFLLADVIKRQHN
jgi:hypothetical protein